MTFVTHDTHDRIRQKTQTLKHAGTFADSNQYAVPSHRQNMTPTCGSKISHVWQ